MNTHFSVYQSLSQRLPLIFATSALGLGLLLSGCDKKDQATPSGDAADTPTTSVTPEVVDKSPIEKTAGTTTSNNESMATDDHTTAAQDATAVHPAASSDTHPSLVSNPTQAGTPEDTVKKALDTLYYGDAKDAANYYKVNMKNFADELAKTQYAFQQTVDSVSLIDTKYNSDKTHATITGELRLKDQSKPTPLTYELQKIENQWKILG